MSMRILHARAVVPVPPRGFAADLVGTTAFLSCNIRFALMARVLVCRRGRTGQPVRGSSGTDPESPTPFGLLIAPGRPPKALVAGKSKRRKLRAHSGETSRHAPERTATRSTWRKLNSYK